MGDRPLLISVMILCTQRDILLRPDRVDDVPCVHGEGKREREREIYYCGLIE